MCTKDGAPSPWLPRLVTGPYAALTDADTVVVSSTSNLDREPDGQLMDALQQAHQAGVRIAALCTGTFILAAAGLLEGRTATTHWLHAALLAQRYPLIDVRADVLYVEDGTVLTSAGKSAALDLGLHMVSSDFGASAANALARRLVVPTHRTGGQAQFITPPRPRPAADLLGKALDWARARLDQPLTVEHLADRAALSSRQLSRRMNAEVGMSPRAWLQHERITRAQDLLERTDASIEQIAAMCGMGTTTTLRRQFTQTLGVTPTGYRTAFRADVTQPPGNRAPLARPRGYGAWSAGALPPTSSTGKPPSAAPAPAHSRTTA
ncbi:GlxA family transcriptional regulator [Pseudactinotalea sp. Z1739]|uniref:GlxA family transcriptional regulator n=1 Tax=Pseudactinotalea sp. Z1739 TaxID=3413028 RepID=UPI003C79CBD4